MGKLTFFGHSCFLMETGKYRILIDPWLKNNPLTNVDPKTMTCDFIVLTHGHFDHCEDAESIAKQCEATIIAVSELAGFYENLGCKTVRMNTGGTRDFGFGNLRLTPAWHSSSVPGPDGPIYAGLAAGLLFTVEDRRIYHAGDTGLFSDMALLNKNAGVDIALLPIGGSVVMGIEDAVEAVKLLHPNCVVPMHYNSFPAIMQDPQVFEAKIMAETDACCHILAPGESMPF